MKRYLLAVIASLAIGTATVVLWPRHQAPMEPSPDFRKIVFVTVADDYDYIKMPVILHLLQTNTLLEASMELPYFTSTAIYRAWIYDKERLFSVTANGYETQQVTIAGPGCKTIYLTRLPDL